MNQKIGILYLLFGILCSCKEVVKQTDYKSSFYYSFNIIKKEHIQTAKLNWLEIEKNIKDSIPIFKNNSDVYHGIRYVLNQINDGHSFFLFPNSKANFFIKDSISIPEIEHDILSNDIGYLKILGFAANDSLSALYTEKIRNTLLHVDRQSNLSGWIIDLRDNRGGKDGAFSLGLEPLYQDSIIGYSIKNNQKYIVHKLLNNTYYRNSTIQQTFPKEMRITNTISNKNRPIAILVNRKTASAGETTAQSFKFQENAMIFGAKTQGLTTGLMIYEYNPSGARLGLATTYFCDENKIPIKGAIIPDIECTSEEALDLAIKWLKNDR